MARNTLSILILFLSLSFSNKALSQCGNILLTTQADVDNYFSSLSCPTIDGQFDINDNGTDPITNLTGIAAAGITTITGNLKIQNCNSLTNLSGLESITSVGVNLSITNNDLLSDVSALDNVVSIGGQLEIGFTAIEEISSFNSLTSVGTFIQMYFNQSLTTISGFASLTTVGLDINITNSFLVADVSGFSSITTVGGNVLFAAVPLGGGLPDFPMGMTIGGNLKISNCFDINNLSPLENITSIGGDLTIEFCGSITECCLLLDYPAIAPGGSIILNTNGEGCSSLDEVGALPPVINGIPLEDQVISCEDIFPDIPTPTATDDCDGDVSSFIMFDSNVTMGNCTETIAEIHEYEWSVSDGSGNMSIETWTVTIENNFTVDLGPDIFECGLGSADLESDVTGIAYEWSTGETTQSITVESSGSYEVIVTSSNGCCASDIIEVGLFAVPVVTATGGILNCQETSINLQGSSNISNVDYSWSGPSGFSSDEQNPTVFEPGEYTLTVTTQDGCERTAAATVISDMETPDITVAGGTIDCINTSITLTGNSSTPNVIYDWTGPGGFTSTMQNPTVTESGEYTLSVTAANSCINMATAEVTSDGSIPNITVTGGTIDCTTSSVTLEGSSSSTDVTYIWTGPGGFTSMIQNPTVTESGSYILSVTAPNGCISMATAQVINDTTLPDLSVTGGTIDCLNSSVVLDGSTVTPDVSFAWTGPGGFTSTMQNPTVNVTGEYQLSITAPNGCVNMSTAQVLGDTILPSISITDGTVNCDSQVIAIVLSTDAISATYSWTGPNGYTSTLQNPLLGTIGVYSCEVTGSNGCINSASYELLDIFNYSEVINTTEATETMGGAAEIIITGGTGPFSIVWDNGDMGTQASDLSAGVYTVSVEDGLGCMEVFTFEILMSTSTTDILNNTNSLEVYPNPALDHVVVNWTKSQFKPTQITIFDVRGLGILKVKVDKNDQQLLDISSLPKGVYLIQLTDLHQSVISKLIKF